MDNRAEVREFLMTRRAKVTPEQAGLPSIGARRVPGLRRSEVAVLAGLSVEYYAKLERGQITGASASVLDALARALQLDEVERRHLQDLARAADGTATASRRRRPRPGARAGSRPALQWMLDGMTGSAVFVRDPYHRMIAANQLGRAFYLPVVGEAGLLALPEGVHAPNLVRFQFLDPASRDFYPDWEAFARMGVGALRVEAGKDPHDPVLQELIGELSTCSEDFRRLWAAHDVHAHSAGTKRFVHPVVGALTVRFEQMELSADPGCMLIAYTAEPATEAAERMSLLSSWAATRAEELREHGAATATAPEGADPTVPS
ncbi:helix-turn-helix transcriptional regulator [Brachybacterium squillarum]|uniref:helix-turn-helix transcriptional regulator n=1 Tax=Brachybacterium squillarum TaxID=661979 RepID=UPI002222BD84|nr:helix-turn-helix transcriptional regulator [Brachybacterium squillarum]MCW1803847.1 helix-turn-helix transcriptional regulator [Brachybacterium squillarum]